MNRNKWRRGFAHHVHCSLTRTCSAILVWAVRAAAASCFRPGMQIRAAVSDVRARLRSALLLQLGHTLYEQIDCMLRARIFCCC
jgi:hypothetical protein